MRGTAWRAGPGPDAHAEPDPGCPHPGGDVPPAVTITCSQFQTQRQAQDFYDYWVGKGFGDFYHLDDDGDGTPAKTCPGRDEAGERAEGSVSALAVFAHP